MKALPDVNICLWMWLIPEWSEKFFNAVVGFRRATTYDRHNTFFEGCKSIFHWGFDMGCASFDTCWDWIYTERWQSCCLSPVYRPHHCEKQWGLCVILSEFGLDVCQRAALNYVSHATLLQAGRQDLQRWICWLCACSLFRSRCKWKHSLYHPVHTVHISPVNTVSVILSLDLLVPCTGGLPKTALTRLLGLPFVRLNSTSGFVFRAVRWLVQRHSLEFTLRATSF